VLLLLRDLRQPVSVPERPLLKPWYRMVRHEERVLLEHGRTVVVFEGGAAREFLPALLPLLDGAHTVDELCELMGSAVAPAVENALSLLAERGLLTAGPRLVADNPNRGRVAESLAAESARDDGIDEIARRLDTATVSLLGDELALDGLARLLQRSAVGGVRREAPAEPRASVVVVGPGGDRAAWNRLALERGGDWLPFGELDGGAVTIGPLIVPNETACFECLVLRRESTSGCPQELALFRGDPPPAPRPSVLAAATALAAELVVRWLGTRDPSLPGALFTVRSHDGISVDTHRVLRVPRCGACSRVAGVAQPSPWHEARVA
jgi:bacteriocin biosynthesis cyclodehydratase domain-containing protein